MDLLAAAGLLVPEARAAAAPVVDDFIDEKLFGADARRTVCAVGVSGGKDSVVAAVELKRRLDAGNFRGKFVLIHSDLGKIEHGESLDQCRVLARHLDCELIITKPRLEFLDRIDKRFFDTRDRFVNLERVRLTTPFPYAGTGRYCTSELKVAPITQELKRRFPNHYIVNAVGLRREESPDRAAKPLWQENKKLFGVKSQTEGIDYYPVLDYVLDDVWHVHDREGLERHAAYVRGNSRVSCAFCFLSSIADLKVSLKDSRNLYAFRRLIAVEFASTFSYQSSKFLAATGYDYLTEEEKDLFAECLRKQEQRLKIESRITPELLFVENFPAFQISIEQANLLAEVRDEIGSLLNLEMKYITGRAVYERYAELIVIRERKEKEKAAKEARRETKLISEAIKTLKQAAAATPRPTIAVKIKKAKSVVALLGEGSQPEQGSLFLEA